MTLAAGEGGALPDYDFATAALILINSEAGIDLAVSWHLVRA